MLALTLRGKTHVVPEESAFEAMRQLYQAQIAGDETAKLERQVSDVEAPGDAPEVSGSPTQDISKIVLGRIQRQNRQITERGMALPPPVYAPGVQVEQLDDLRHRIVRPAWSACPDVVDALSTLWRLVRREERREHVVPLHRLRMHDDGSVDWGDGKMMLEEPALKQLLSTAGAFPRGTTYLCAVEPGLRAYNWKRRAGHLDDKQIKLRVRRNPLTGWFGVFAVVSPSYSTVDIDDLVSAIGPIFRDKEKRGITVYDSVTSSLQVDGWSPMLEGSDVQVGVRITTSDIGQGGLTVHGTLLRPGPMNVLVVTPGSAPIYYTTHRGDMARISSQIRSSLLATAHYGADLIERWSALEEAPISALFDVSHPDMQEVFTGLVTGWMNLKVRREVLVAALLETYQHEPGGTLADLVSAVTRLHSSPAIDSAHLSLIENEARSLVFRLSEAV